MNRWSLMLVTVAAALAPSAHAVEPSPVDGTWQKHEGTFSYFGIVTRYSCDGLEDRVRRLLGMVGARPDFHVSGACTSARVVPNRDQWIRVTFYTLAPAGSPPPARQTGMRSTPTSEAARGEWREVEWTPTGPPELASGDCELVDQFAKQILPLFATRGLENRMRCTPNEANRLGIRLKFEVLAALPDAQH